MGDTLKKRKNTVGQSLTPMQNVWKYLRETAGPLNRAGTYYYYYYYYCCCYYYYYCYYDHSYSYND